MLVCPRDHLPLDDLKCAQGHEYLLYDGIPVLLLDDVPETFNIATSLKQAKGLDRVRTSTADIDDYVQESVAGAAGYLYVPLIGRLTSYPIPELPLPRGTGTFLDVGCNWGRWTIAAARKGYRVVGVDSSLDSLLAARRVSKQLGIEAEFICADARYLPFPDRSFDQGFSFSVLQHFSKPDAQMAFCEMKRIAEHIMVEIPGKYGIRALQNQLRRGFKEGQGFEVRYWSPKELRQIGKIEVHAYLGTGVLPCDAYLLPFRYKLIVGASDVLTRLSSVVAPLRIVADSYYVIT